ncbi:uncharacterized protein LOC112536670 [Ricinus communis]|uniref:uncharacterized protein LOC112536670 n=1 Tax=Ricinus communis TaxID=3988 RepID=UPI00201B2983|nr:uncharacterized protein LOC112536670 [Ricinus communis]
MTSEIIEEKEEENDCFINRKAQKERIRQIIEYQKSLYWSSSSATAAASSSAFYTSNKSGILLDLMKNGNTSLRRLFEMEHTSLATHFQDYSGSPVIKTIPLWGSSETDDEIHDSWAEIKQIGAFKGLGNDGVSNFASDGSFLAREFGFKDKNMTIGSKRRKLTRKKSFRRLPGFWLWRCRRFKFIFGLRLKRLSVMICGKIF